MNGSIVNTFTSIVATALLAAICTTEVNGEIDRHKTDFYYQHIGYQILSETDKTVAVTQNFDIDAGSPSHPQKINSYHDNDLGNNGFLMGSGLEGPYIVIPQTVYDDKGVAYTVTDLANYAINWVETFVLVLPPTLERLNGGICAVSGLCELYLPENLKEIEGISVCPDLETLHIPWNVEIIRKYSLFQCGMNFLYLPPSVKTLEDYTVQYCDRLWMAMLSGVETMGNGCFQACQSYVWANLPECLRSMGEECFNDCPNLNLVSLPWSEINMKGCFNGCPSISRIEVLAPDPYTFPENSFRDVDRNNCVLSVPEGSEDKYRNAEGWKEFLNITGDLPATAGVTSTMYRDDFFRAFGGKGSMKIFSQKNATIEVFSTDGKRMAVVNDAGVNEIALPAGVYLVTSRYGSRKVLVN